MTHIRLDDGFGEHQKIVRLSDAAFRLYVNGLCYCSRRQTDGFIPALVAPLIMGCSIKTLRAPIAALCDAGLWEPLETGGWYVHDYLKHQRSRAQIEQQKTAGKRRLERWRNGVTNVNETPLVTTPEGRGQSKSKRAEGSSNELAAAAAGAREKPPPDDFHRRAYNAWDRQSPGGLLPPIIEKLDAAIEDGTPIEWIELACESAADNGGYKGWKYFKTTLDRYKRDGTTADTRKPQPSATPADATYGVNTGAGEFVKTIDQELPEMRRLAAEYRAKETQDA